jgi:hypothetical protein
MKTFQVQQMFGLQEVGHNFLLVHMILVGIYQKQKLLVQVVLGIQVRVDMLEKLEHKLILVIHIKNIL